REASCAVSLTCGRAGDLIRFPPNQNSPFKLAKGGSMRKQLAIGIALVIAGTTFGRADDKWQPPPAPNEWKYVVGKDGTYEFLCPKEPGRTGTRDRDFRVGGARGKMLVNYLMLRDGTLLEVNVATLSGPAFNGVKIGEMYDGLIESEKDDGFSVG